MAKVVKDTRKTIDVDSELKKLKKETTKDKQKEKKSSKKVSTKKPSFIKEVNNEVSKVKWPTKKDMIKYSVATISFIVFFAAFFYLIDLVMALLKEVF